MKKLANLSEPAKLTLRKIGVESEQDLTKIDYKNLAKLEGITEQDIFQIEQEFDLKEPEEDMPVTSFTVIGDLSCNNAPKRQILRDLIIAMCSRDEKLLKEQATDDILGQVIDNDIIVNPNDLLNVVPFETNDILIVNIYVILSHGKEGAAHLLIRNKKDEICELGLFASFENHKKEAKINKIKIFRQ